MATRQISGKAFLIGCMIPLIMLFKWDCWPSIKNKTRQMLHKNKVALEYFERNTQSPISNRQRNSCEKENRSVFAQVILASIEGPYKIVGIAISWEFIVGFRKLLINVTTLVQNPFLQLLAALIMSLLFLAHHSIIYPFKSITSNRIELMALTFLCIHGTINLIKANFAVSGILLNGPNVEIIKMFELIEHSFLIILIFCVTILCALNTN